MWAAVHQGLGPRRRWYRPTLALGIQLRFRLVTSGGLLGRRLSGRASRHLLAAGLVGNLPARGVRCLPNCRSRSSWWSLVAE